MSTLVLFDLPSKGRNACWSPNPWKTRLALNYKGLEYVTQWIEYPDIAPTFKQFGIEPNKPGPPEYTIPVLRLTGKKYIMDSKPIAEALEKEFPQPSLHLDSPILPKVEQLLLKATGAARSEIIPEVPKQILNPASVEYFETTREKSMGAPLHKVQEEKGGEAAWKAGEESWKELAALLKEKGGPFFLGETVSYADFYVVGWLQFAKRTGRLERIFAFDPAYQKLYEASAKFLERDDH